MNFFPPVLRRAAFRVSYPVTVVKLKLYSAVKNARLGFAGFTFTLGPFRLTPRRKPTLGR